MKLVVISKTNLASSNIGDILKRDYSFPEEVVIFETQNSVLDFEQDKEFVKLVNSRQLKADSQLLVIVASSHKSAQAVNTLTCHSPGNWDKAELGGEERKLSISPALYLRAALLELSRQREERKLANYEVSLEVTHHGPSIDMPVIFVEVGSSEVQWNDMDACGAVAETIYKLATKEPEAVSVGVGFGGNHYAPTFTKRVLEGKIALGHICPKYYAQELTEEMFLQAINKTTPKPNYVILEWKGLKADEKQKIILFCEKNNIKWVKDKEI